MYTRRSGGKYLLSRYFRVLPQQFCMVQPKVNICSVEVESHDFVL